MAIVLVFVAILVLTIGFVISEKPWNYLLTFLLAAFLVAIPFYKNSYIETIPHTVITNQFYDVDYDQLMKIKYNTHKGNWWTWCSLIEDTKTDIRISTWNENTK